MSSTRPEPGDNRARGRSRAWVALVLAAAGAVLLARTFRLAVVRGHSMEPSLKQGDYLLTESASAVLGTVRRFDLVTFRWPGFSGRELVKRVIALPGETVEIRAGKVLVEGKELAEPFLHVEGFSCWGPDRVPEGHYFVLGDNRVSSVDSAVWGPVPARMITGVVRARVPLSWGEK